MNRFDDLSSKVSGGDAAAQPPQPATFEEGLSHLAELVGRLEGGQLGLAESIAAYERGVTLVRALHGELSDVEQRVRMLTAPPPDRPRAGSNRGESTPDDGPAAAFEDGPATPFSDGDTPAGDEPTTRRKGGAKGGSGRATRSAGGRPRSLPGMDDPPAEV